MHPHSDIDATEDVTDKRDLEWLHTLVGDWQLLADLSFADLLLWVPATEAPGRFRVTAHCRPTTGATAYPEDVVGLISTGIETELMHQAWESQEIIIAPGEDELHDAHAPIAGAEVVPVMREGRIIAVLTRHTEELRRSVSSRLERNYRACASMLLTMIAEGDYPNLDDDAAGHHGDSRVGDGIVVLNREGRVRYASPNGISVLHRLGHDDELEGRYLNEVVAGLVEQLRPVDETLPVVLTGRAPWSTEVESGSVIVTLRAIPFTRAGNRIGAAILLRDVSEIRRRDRQLLGRDAMIREMHHRVKNNLQTVAALLRLQTRRISSAEAKGALEEATRRVAIIAVVHDVLSQGLDSEVDFDEIVDKGLKLTPELASPHVEITLQRTGSFGKISSVDATSLALALTELVTNAVEHGFPLDLKKPETDERLQATVWVEPERLGDRLRVTVADDGVGLPENQGPGTGLGTQIVKTLVSTDLGGEINWRAREGGGTEVIIDVPLGRDR